LARRETAEQAAHRLLIEVDRLRDPGVTTRADLAKKLSKSGVPTPSGSTTWMDPHHRLAAAGARDGVPREGRHQRWLWRHGGGLRITLGGAS
jgi:hypothetical protein